MRGHNKYGITRKDSLIRKLKGLEMILFMNRLIVSLLSH